MKKNNQNVQFLRVSVNAFERAIAEDYSPIVEAEWRGIKVRIKKHLSFKRMLEFVDSVVESCFTADTGTYLPEVKDFVTRAAILEYYGNFTLPHSMERKYDLIYSSDAVSFVCQYVDQAQFNSMMAAIDKKIEHRAQSNIEALTKQMNEVVAGFNVLEKNLSGIFNGIDNDTVSKIAGAIANGSFDEEKLIDAFMQKKTEAEAAK